MSQRGPPAGTKPVDPLHAFPLSNTLLVYLANHVSGWQDAINRAIGSNAANQQSIDAATSAVKMFQFSHGQSNPTFALQIEDKEGFVVRRYVLRKKPGGVLLPSAHAIEREYRIMSALRSSRVPVPLTYCLCEDASIIGTSFFVMDYVQGRIFKDITLKGMNRSDRLAIYAAMVHTLAQLHRVDVNEVGLADLAGSAAAQPLEVRQARGIGGSYPARQVKRWSAQYAASQTRSLPAMDRLISTLNTSLPSLSNPHALSLTHGDFRLDNLIFHPTEPRILAVLDWELCTLGHPLADLAYASMPFYIPAGIPNWPGLKGLPLSMMGIPTQNEFLSAYVRMVGMHGMVPAHDYQFMVALSFFRTASILQGVFKRSLQGNASQSDQSALLGKLVPGLVDMALGVLEGEVTPESERTGLEQVAQEIAMDATGTERLKRARAAASRHAMLPQAQLRASLDCFGLSDRFWELHGKLKQFMDEHIYPNEATYLAQHESLKTANGGSPWHIPPILAQLQQEAKKQGLWNLFLPRTGAGGQQSGAHSSASGTPIGAGLSNVEYAPLCELMGRSPYLAPEACNCSAPDTGNMETLALYGSAQQKEAWLEPLLKGEIRSCFAMTEKDVASSDATNISCRFVRDGDSYIVHGRKVWSSGAMDPRCRLAIVMGRVEGSERMPRHKQQSMLIVPMPAPGLKIVRPLHVFGYDDAPHGHAELVFDGVRVPVSNMLLGEGRGFEIAQGRLGPGRIHHCMRLIGMAERALDLMIMRTISRTAFGGRLASKGSVLKDIADSRIEIDSCRLLCMQAAAMMDKVGNKLAAQQIAMIKVLAPNMTLRVIDRSIQAHGAMGVCQDTILPQLWAAARTLRLADGPDEVHRDSIAKMEIRKAKL